MKKYFPVINVSKRHFSIIILFLIWIETEIVYLTYFNLNITKTDPLQILLLIVNPLPISAIIICLISFLKKRLYIWANLLFLFIQNFWLFVNIIYYREFSDFISIQTIESFGLASNNIGKSLIQIVHFPDLWLFLDVLILFLLIHYRKIVVSNYTNHLLFSLAGFLSLIASFAVLFLANVDRPQLLTRSFDNNYLVKYLGMDGYFIDNLYQNSEQSSMKEKAKPKELKKVLKFIKSKKTHDIEYFGKEKNKDVFIIHLESLQQFMIDYKYEGKEVLPNLDKFYHDKHTISFDNFYHQVAQGKTSDAEMMLENSLFGLPTGSAMVSYGTQDTFDAAPEILDEKGYTTASLHGDVPTFWNRDNTYKSWGYEYFFSKNYYPDNNKDSFNAGYGMKDKIFMKDSVSYIQKLPQPFYAKIITVTNHYPYDLNKYDEDISSWHTGDNSVDHYVQTAHYLDEAFGEFINYLKVSGLYNKSLIVLYGDHYGISNNHRAAISKILNKSKLTDYDLANFQKVPFMIHASNLKGFTDHTYGGEIDVLPTLLNILGVNPNRYLFFGTDLLSKDHDQTVAFRDGDFVSPEFTKYLGNIYNTSNGLTIKKMSKTEQTSYDQQQSEVNRELSYSDDVLTGDLLRFYHPKGFKHIDKDHFNYQKAHAIKELNREQDKRKNSIYYLNKDKSTVHLYHTDAPELKDEK
ncbi:LTA synthase family protein [Oenococcus oeni]|uniref:LTA synthase family protein n=1 Tax=Oenococcus oeni TaxID=1247 RepID=UPI0005105C5C|nr:LTA synthase family protein [Oenococcus oeni]KGI02875.1 phosphoglycerol transferase [Oenococcus oeni IOEB_C52]